MGSFWKQGEPQVWGTAAALSVTLLMVLVLVVVVMVNGLGFFWPSDMALVSMSDGSRLMGQISDREKAPPAHGKRLQFKVGNRDIYGQDFRWVEERDIRTMSWPHDSVVLERKENGNFHGFLKSVSLEGLATPAAASPWETLRVALKEVSELRETLAKTQQVMARMSSQTEQLRLKIRKLSHSGATANRGEIDTLTSRREKLLSQFDGLLERFNESSEALDKPAALFTDAAGEEKEIPLSAIVRAYRPNSMGVFGKASFYAGKVRELLLDEPRESNTEGGLFPAIFGTVMMVLLMSVFSLPFGVVAAVYLREYAREGLIVRIVRIAVNNLAGVPSIVYGVFGLGFFVYGIGGSLDKLFFPERLPTPVFGTGGILWASLTLALLTVPVVIVATEESLASIPKGIREGSLALGATKFQTLTRVLLPMATPGIMTGLVLSMARAVGEVAPLMMVGVVKLAPTLPFDGQFPFFHMDRKFMHLGFHIYDVGFQSPNVDMARPMVYMTTFLLVGIVLVLNLAAIVLRNRLRKKFSMGSL